MRKGCLRGSTTEADSVVGRKGVVEGAEGGGEGEEGDEEEEGS